MLPWIRESALCAPRRERPHPPQRRHNHRCEGWRCALLPWIRESALCAPRQERPHPPQRRHIHRCEGWGRALLPWLRESALCAPRQERPHPPQRRHIHRCEGRGRSLLPWIREARSVRRGRSDPIRRSAGTFTDARAEDALCCHGFGKVCPQAFSAGRRARALSLPGARHFAGDCPEARRRKVLPWLRESALCAPRREQPHPPQRRHIHRCEGWGRALLPWIRESASQSFPRRAAREGAFSARRSSFRGRLPRSPPPQRLRAGRVFDIM